MTAPRKKRSFILLFLLLSICFIVFRVSILQGISGFLVYEDALQKSPVMFVLSGGPLDRGNEAVNLYNAGWAKTIICTGENIPHDFAALGIDSLESVITKLHIVSQGVPEIDVQLIRKGTSTQEECEAILNYCKTNNITTAIIVSSELHTRRIHRTINKQFKNTSIKILLQGATNSSYNKDFWWQDENGLIDVNNEYIKLFYYWWKY